MKQLFVFVVYVIFFIGCGSGGEGLKTAGSKSNGLTVNSFSVEMKDFRSTLIDIGSFGFGYVSTTHYWKANIYESTCIDSMYIEEDCMQRLKNKIDFVAHNSGLNFTYNIESQPKHGKLIGKLPKLYYKPNRTYHGKDSFTYSVSDGNNKSNIATVDINIKAFRIVEMSNNLGFEGKIKLSYDNNGNISRFYRDEISKHDIYQDNEWRIAFYHKIEDNNYSYSYGTDLLDNISYFTLSYEYDYDNKIDLFLDRKLKLTRVFKYNDKNRMVVSTYGNSIVLVDSDYYYQYDSNGNLMELKSYYKDSHILESRYNWEYDDFANLLTYENNYLSSHENNNSFIFTYDKYSNLVTYLNNSNDETYKGKILYNNNDKPIAYISDTEDFRLNYNYDNRGNIISVSNNVNNDVSYYNYDENGNLTACGDYIIKWKEFE